MHFCWFFYHWNIDSSTLVGFGLLCISSMNVFLILNDEKNVSTERNGKNFNFLRKQSMNFLVFRWKREELIIFFLVNKFILNEKIFSSLKCIYFLMRNVNNSLWYWKWDMRKISIEKNIYLTSNDISHMRV